jgi:hypothetical protein
MSLVIACADHLLVDLPLFGCPVAVLAGAIFLIARVERKRPAR